MGENLAQKLAGLIREKIFRVFLDVRKTYDSLEGGRCIDILRGYGLGPNL